MTTTQQIRLAGFEAHLSVRGVDVVSDDGTPFRALIEPLTNEGGQYDLGGDSDISVAIHIARTELEDVTLSNVLTFTTDDDDEIVYRVKHYEDNPRDPATRFMCAMVEASA